MLRREIEDRFAMSVECFPITVLPHVSQIYRDYLAMAGSAEDAAVRRWYGAEPFAWRWLGKAVAPVQHPYMPTNLLHNQPADFCPCHSPTPNISKLRSH